MTRKSGYVFGHSQRRARWKKEKNFLLESIMFAPLFREKKYIKMILKKFWTRCTKQKPGSFFSNKKSNLNGWRWIIRAAQKYFLNVYTGVPRLLLSMVIILLMRKPKKSPKRCPRTRCVAAPSDISAVVRTAEAAVLFSYHQKKIAHEHLICLFIFYPVQRFAVRKLRLSFSDNKPTCFYHAKLTWQNSKILRFQVLNSGDSEELLTTKSSFPKFSRTLFRMK